MEEAAASSEAKSPPISPLSLSTCDTLAASGPLRLDIGEFEGEPFSTNFTELFGALGLHVGKDEDTQDKLADKTREPETFSNMRDMSFGRQYPGIEELVILSSKRPHSVALPTIHEDYPEPRFTSVPSASLSDFEYDFEGFHHPSAKGTTVCTRRDNRVLYAMKRKRAARYSSWAEQQILEALSIQGQLFVPQLRWSFYSGEHIYIVTDLCTGSNLDDLVRQRGPLGIYHATFYAAELVSAISGLHEAGIVHRCIEPKNVLLNKEGHIILTHFDDAGFVKDTADRTHRMSSIPEVDFTASIYCAPEIILGWAHDLSVDCWSFGMLLHYLVFGMTPYSDFKSQGVQVQVYDQVVRTSITSELLRPVHPMARDLVLKCLERNPALRCGIKQVKEHPYFSSIDWDKVSSLQAEVPTFDKSPVSFNTRPVKAEDGHRRHSSLTLSLLSNRDDHPARLKSSSPVHRRSHSFQRPQALQITGNVIPMSPLGLLRTLDRAVGSFHEEGTSSSHMSPEPLVRCAMSVTCEREVFTENLGEPKQDFWDTLDKEEGASAAASVTSLEFGTATAGVSYAKAPKLRKYRSAIQSRSRLFSLSTSSFQNKMRRKPRSTGALRQLKPVEVIENLPLGIHQIGSGIGFNYTVAPAVPSKVSIGSFTPSCHLFQRGFSVRNLTFGLGASSTSRIKAKVPGLVISPPSTLDLQPSAGSSYQVQTQPQRREVGHGTFIREMSRSPSWILSPTDCLPSPMALVNVDSPASVATGSELLSPITLVNSNGEEEDCHVNITIPKNLELELGFPLASWAPDSTLRLVPQTASAITLPYIDSVDSSVCIDSNWT